MESKKISESLKIYFKNVGKTQEDLAEALGVSHPYVNALLNGKPFGKKQAKKWESLFGISAHWLLTGAGDMLVDSNVTNGVIPTTSTNTTITTGDINGNGNNIAGGMVVQTPSSEVESVVVEEVPYLARPVIESRDTNLREYVESEDVRTIIPQGLICTGIDFARKIYSDAMAPDIREGDIILCNFVPDASNLVDGDTYVVETTTYGCVMRDIKHEGDEVVLMARNGRSPDLRVKQSEIRSVAVPIQLIRSTFSQRTDFSKIIREKDERIGLLVEREFDHIRHTDKLLEQIDRVTSQQGKLIEALVGRA